MPTEPDGVSRRTLLTGAALGSLGLAATGTASRALAATPADVSVVQTNPAIVLTDTFGAVPGWDRRGVVLSQSLPWESSLLQDPCLVYGESGGSLFKLWYGSLHGVGYATSDDGISWTKATDPVLVPTLASESQALNQPSVVYRAGVWHMTYFGVSDSGNGQIHYAWAAQPGGPWTKRGVVLTSTMPWEDDYIYNSSLVYDAQQRIWKMWYTAGKIASAGGEPQYICYATAADPAGPWQKYDGNPIIRPVQDDGWASLGIGGPNVRKLAGGQYETRIVGWQASYPSRGGRLVSHDGLRWQLDRSAMQLDLGIAGGPEDGMIYRQFVVNHLGRDYVYYNAKNNRPGWNETINLAIWSDAAEIVDPAKWSMTQGWEIPNGASYEVRDAGAWCLGNAPAGRPQTLQGNVLIPARDYTFTASITPTSDAVSDRDNVLLARATARNTYYYAGIGSWGNKYAIGVLVDGQNSKLVGVGDAQEIAKGEQHDLRFVLNGSQLSLYDSGQLVLSVVDPTLIPEASYVGMQNSNGSGTAKFSNVMVQTLPANN